MKAALWLFVVAAPMTALPLDATRFWPSPQPGYPVMSCRVRNYAFCSGHLSQDLQEDLVSVQSGGFAFGW